MAWVMLTITCSRWCYVAIPSSAGQGVVVPLFGHRRCVVEESSGLSEGSSGLSSGYRLGVVTRRGSRPHRVASMFTDLIGCAGRRRLSLDWVTASPSYRALHLSNRGGLFVLRSTAVLPLFGFNCFGSSSAGKDCIQGGCLAPVPFPAPYPPASP